jgi:hypothetical protein
MGAADHSEMPLANATGRHSVAWVEGQYSRLPLLVVSMIALLAALWGGLLRLGWGLPAFQPGLYVSHGPLMVFGFLGTLISLERAVALGKGWSYAAPALSGVGALMLVFGFSDPIGAALITLGSVGLIANFAAILYRQTALFTITMAAGAIAWFIGNCVWLAGTPIIEMFYWWAAFLVLTIVGERLELSRLTGLTERNRPWFIVSVAPFIVGLVVARQIPAVGLRLAGLGMLALALWLAQYDLARRTVKQKGLTRFIAANLLAGYFWLGVGGVAWLWFGNDLTTFHYDVMLHSIFLGFVFSMIFAHAPVIFPAVTQRPLPYRRVFYVHCTLLQLSLLLRIGGDLLGSYPAYQWGGLLNVVAVLVFVGNTARAIAMGKQEGGKQSSPNPAVRRAMS